MSFPLLNFEQAMPMPIFLLVNENVLCCTIQIVKAIDAVTREQLVRLMSIFGIRNATPVFNMVPSIGPFKPVALLPTITEEDRVILNNVQKILEFLTAGSSISTASNEVL